MKQLILKTLLILFFTSTFIDALGVRKLYLSPNGKDSNPGTNESPLATLHKALEKIQSSSDTCTIIFKEGIYYLNKSVSLSNYKNLSIVGEKGSLIKLRGSIHIALSAIRPINNTERKQHHIAGKLVYVVNLSALNIHDYGKLRQVGYGTSVKASWAEPILNSQAMHLSRWPNTSYTRIGAVISNDSINKNASEGHFHYGDTRVNKWKQEDEIWLSGYFRYGWAEDAVKVENIDTTKQTIKTLQSSYYGFSSDKDYNRWYAYNVLSELDYEGEYYIDRINGLLYFYTEKKISSLELSSLRQPLINISNSANIQIQNIVFGNSRDRAIVIRNSDKITLQNCQFRNLGSYAIHVDKGSTNCNIDNCLIKDVGVGAIILEGGNRNKLKNGNNKVSRTTISYFNRIDGAYKPAIKVTGVGNIIDRCEISQAPNMAVRINGNNHKIMNCHFFNICQDINDQGVIYTGRNPSERGHLIMGNIFRNITTSMDNSSVYFDDGACGAVVKNNIFIRPGRYAVLIGGGSNFKVSNNLFIDGNVGIHLDNRLQTRSKKWLVPGGLFEKRMNEVKFMEEPFLSFYPGIDKYFEHMGKPHAINISGNKFINNKICFRGDSTLVSNIKNNSVENSHVTKYSIEEVYNIIDWPFVPLNEIGYQANP